MRFCVKMFFYICTRSLYNGHDILSEFASEAKTFYKVQWVDGYAFRIISDTGGSNRSGGQVIDRFLKSMTSDLWRNNKGSAFKIEGI